MELMELMDLIRGKVTITAYGNKELYIAKPEKEAGHLNPLDVVFDIFIENEIEFNIKYFDYEDVFEVEGGLAVIFFKEEDY